MHAEEMRLAIITELMVQLEQSRLQLEYHNVTAYVPWRYPFTDDTLVRS